jgi:hypothetical protein
VGGHGVTRPTKRGPARFTGILESGAIGYTPDVPTGEPPDPIDHADSAAWEIPALVDDTEVADLNEPEGTLTDGGGTLTFTDPTNANDGDSGSVAVIGSYAGNGSTDYKGYLRSDLGASYTVYEMFADGDQNCGASPTWYYQWSADGSTGWTTVTTTDIPTQLAPDRWEMRSTLDTPTSARYWRLVHDDGVTGGFECGLELFTWEIRGASVVSSEVAWVDAFAVNDGLDATSDFVSEDAVTAADDVFLRGALALDPILSSVVLRIGTEDAGSATITVEGATESDYSDAVTLDSTTFTGTGSYTAQDVTFDLPGTTGYRYIRFLLTVAQGIRVYEVELTGVATSGVTDHGALTGLADDDHPQYVTHTEGDADYAAIGHTHGATGALDDLTDVDTSGVADNDVLAYDSGTNTWVPVAPGTPTLDWGEDADISTLDYDDVAAAGVLDEIARADHVHGMPSAGVGGGGDLVIFDEVVLGSDQADITITGIPNTYRDLVISVQARSAVNGEFGTLHMRVGDGSIDTGSNYGTAREIFGSGGATFGGRGSSSWNVATIAGDTATAGAFSGVEAVILGYVDTAMHKYFLANGYMDGASDHYVSNAGGSWRNTSAEIDQVRIFDGGGANLKAGSRMTIWGRNS